MRGPQAVIFDLDGTLADSELAHEQALRAAAEVHGMTFSPEYFRSRCVGLGEAACFRMLAAQHGRGLTETLLTELIATKLERFAGAVTDGGIRPHEGAIELVRAVSGRWPVGVCSGSSRGSVTLILRAIGLGPEFSTVVTSGDVAEPKPAPEGYLLAAARLDIPPEGCVVVEDSPTGVEAARAAGMLVVAVEHSFPRAYLTAAHEVVGSIADLTPAMLGGVGSGP